MRKARKGPTPQARRRTHLRLPGLRHVYDAVLGASGELAGCADALDAELWFSANVNVLRGHAPTGEAFENAMLDLIEAAAASGCRDRLVLLRTMAAVGPHGLTEAAMSAAKRMAAQLPDDALPHWIDLLGEATVGDCYLFIDVFGEAEQVYCEFIHRDGLRPYGLVATVDLTCRGALGAVTFVTAAKDGAVVAEFRRAARREGAQFEAITPERASSLIRAAVLAFLDQASPQLASRSQSDEEIYAALPSLIRRVDAMPQGDGPTPERHAVAELWPPPRRQELVEKFLAAHPDGWADARLARMIVTRTADLSVEVLGCPPDHIGPASVTRLYGEILPGVLAIPESLLRQVVQISETWVEWLTESRDLPGKAHRQLRRITPGVLMLFAARCRDRRINPHYPYIADLPAAQAIAGDRLQALLDRRWFAVPLPGHRGDGVVELPVSANGLPAGATHVDQLDAADPACRELITAIEQTSRGTHQGQFPEYIAVAEQIWNGEPAEVWQAAERMTAAGLPRQRVLKELAETWRRHNDGMRSTDRYVAALQAIGAAGRTRK